MSDGEKKKSVEFMRKCAAALNAGVVPTTIAGWLKEQANHIESAPQPEEYWLVVTLSDDCQTWPFYWKGSIVSLMESRPGLLPVNQIPLTKEEYERFNK